MKAILLTILTTLTIVGCTGTEMPAYDGSNPSAYFKENCHNKSIETQKTEQCQKARSDKTMRAIRKDPS